MTEVDAAMRGRLDDLAMLFPACTDKRLARLVHDINDGIEDEDERAEKMRKLAPLVINTADRDEEIEALSDRLAVKRLRTIVLPLADTWPEDIREEVVSAIEGVCDALGCGAARSAAWSAAGSAARSARSAAESAAWSARSAARSARSAAESAAWSAARSAEADLLITELEAFHANDQPETEAVDHGECTAVCAACGGKVVVPTMAGVPPYVLHEPECPREGWSAQEAAEYDDGTQATRENWRPA